MAGEKLSENQLVTTVIVRKVINHGGEIHVRYRVNEFSDSTAGNNSTVMTFHQALDYLKRNYDDHGNPL